MEALAEIESLEPWLVAQVRVGREQLSAQHLRTRGYDVLLPCSRERRRWSDRVRTIERAVFPGYVFVRTGDTVTGPVVTTPHVIRLVSDHHGPLPVSSDEIHAIRRIVDNGLNAESCQFVAGQRVTIETGPLRGVSGMVVRTTSQRRLVVTIALLQRSVSVELEPEWVATSVLDD